MAHATSRLKAIGEACLLALVVAGLAAVPTALRASAMGTTLLAGWVAGVALLLPLVAVAVGLARAAGRGFRSINGQASRKLGILGVLLWIGLASPALAVIAALLKATTHHRGLGGATFGVLGLVAIVGTALLAFRIVAVARRLVARGVAPWVVAAVGGAIGMLPVLVLAMPLARIATDPVARHVHAAMLDGAIVCVAAALATTSQLPERVRGLSGSWGLILAVLVSTAGVAWASRSPSLGQAVVSGGGLPAALLDLLGGCRAKPDTSKSADEGGPAWGGDPKKPRPSHRLRCGVTDGEGRREPPLDEQGQELVGVFSDKLLDAPSASDEVPRPHAPS
jgi:hypothetical protein